MDIDHFIAGHIADDQPVMQAQDLAINLKDVNLALEAAKAKQALLPAAEIVRETMLEAVEQGLGSKDWSALAKVTRRRAGL